MIGMAAAWERPVRHRMLPNTGKLVAEPEIRHALLHKATAAPRSLILLNFYAAMPQRMPANANDMQNVGPDRTPYHYPKLGIELFSS